MRPFILAFLLAVICYAFFYHGIEHRRTRKGPWEVTFTNSPQGTPLVLINQPKLAITNVEIRFPDQALTGTNQLGERVFSEPQPVPFPVPFGKCLFMDTTFLPGTLTFELYGHEIELLPRVLVIDRQEYPWLSGSPVTVHSQPQRR
jgi:hypothetical protein